MSAGARVGADVGGTFTDVLSLDPGGGVRYRKLLSTPPGYERAVVDAVTELAADGVGVSELAHGTTVATNAVLERRGARTALVTTAGFRDVLELRRMRMPHLYDYFWTKPLALVPRSLRFEIAERVSVRGEVVVPLEEAAARALASRLAQAAPEAVAVCLLHAHLHPGHERALGAILREELPGVPISLSSDILREQQEYERTATTVVNAYVGPLMGRYVRAIRTGLDAAGVAAPLAIMQSSGGLMTDADAARRPVVALESGPAAGVVAALALARALGQPNAIAFDMGGTTAKASLIEEGRVARSLEYEVGSSLSSGSRLLRGSGELIRIPTIDIAEVGAGGGSVAYLDEAGGLHVGPRSAGADPGPACYGRGGSEPTVTDANVVLGYIPTGPLGEGDLSVSGELATAAVDGLAGRLGLSTGEAARGIHDLANATMMRALRAVSTEKGRDPADFVLIAYGGSGPLHAAALAAELGVATAVVPPLAGLFSAAGLLYARAEFHDVRFCRESAREPNLGLLAGLEAEMRASLLAAVGRESEIEWQRLADVRYRGQNWSITVELPGGLDAAGVAGLVERFEAEHERLYGTRLEPGSPVDIRALRLIALGPPREPFSLPAAAGAVGPPPGTTRLADFGVEVGPLEAPVVGRAALLAEPREGPLLIDEYDTTVVVPPGWSVRADAATGALVLGRSLAALAASPAQAEAIARGLVANALGTTADEMATTIFRTAHSAIVRDAMDFSAALCGPSGETVAQAVTIPLQLGSIPNVMKTVLERFGGHFRPGDVYIVNDPFDGASHTPDVFVVKPAFNGESLIGFAVTIAHHGDLGGRVPGSCACDSTEVFQEGLRLPLLRLYAAGEPVEEVFAIIRANVRIPHEMLGDLSAQVAACTIGERGLCSLAARYGEARLAKLMADLLDHSEALLRAEIARWPDGSAEFTDYLDSDGIDVVDVAIRVKLTIAGDGLTADFSASDPQVRGALNCTPSFAQAATYHTVMAASATEIPCTSGATRPVTVLTRPGTVTHVLSPGASSMRGITGYRVSDVMNGALAQLIPGRVPAAGEGGSTLAFFAGRLDGEPFVYSELVVGTWGGRPVADGNDGLANPCASMANIPVELAESDWPIVIDRYGLVADSGGAGRFRGGLAVERVWRVVAPDTFVHVRSDRQVHRPYGLAGGLPGGASQTLLTRADGSVERMPPMFVALLQPGDVLHHRQPGGGGFGDPLARDPDAVARDVLNEKVSPEAARALYGVAVTAGGAIDLEATAALRRAKLSA